MSDYQTFLSRKHLAAEPAGFDVASHALVPALFPFQRDIVQWALHQGRAAVFADCGVGKGPISLEFARLTAQHTGKPSLIVAPLAVAAQFQQEADKFGIAITRCRAASEVVPGVNVTNYEMLSHFDASMFGSVILDECFAAGTLIDTPSGAFPIETLRAGDEIINAAGIDVLSDVHCREVPYAVRVTFSGRAIISSPNHPYFTRRGWVAAQDLEPGDEVVATPTAMRLVRDHLHRAITPDSQEAVLRDILLSEMADVSTGHYCQSAFSRSRSKAGPEATGMVRQRQPQSRGGARTVSQPQPTIDRPRSASQDLPHIESHEAQTFRAWWQWSGDDRTAAFDAECSWTRMGSGVCLVTGSTHTRLSNELQTRLSERRAASVYRSGWVLSQRAEEGSRSQEDGEGHFTRVDRLEVLEQGHPDLDQYRDADGKLYFYDLTGTRHPSFSVNGFLVHNSGILKNYTGATKRLVTEMFSRTPYRLCCTATPAPNDHLELGNHAEFLGVLSSHEMIARWFINSDQAGVYRLKRHGAADFWRWVASWAVSVRTPADMGYPAGDYVLPPLSMQRIIVPVDLIDGRGDQLFRSPDLSATGLHQEMRRTAPARAEAVANLVNPSPESWLVWCNTDYEADALNERIPDAVEVRGSMPEHVKEQRLNDFKAGRIRVLVTKPRVAGYGLNLQGCHNTAFVGLSYSFEQFYQAIRRVYRFGQTQPVNAFVVAAETEDALVSTIERKMAAFEDQRKGMLAASRLSHGHQPRKVAYRPSTPMQVPTWLESLEYAA